MENKFLAHIAEDGREQTVFEHLAAEFSRPFGGEAQGLLAGTAHDIGKYSAAFQRRLTGDSRRVDHATAGAFECMGRGQPFAAFAVAGHHGGLPDGGGRGDGPEAATFGTDQRAGRGGLEPYGAWPGSILPGGQPPPFAKQNPGAGMFFIRMLYSVWWPRIFWIPRPSCPGSRAGVVQAAGKRRRLPSGHSDVPRPPSKPTERDSPHAESCRSLPGERGLKPRCWQSRRLRRRSLPLTEGIRV
ncbi:MAG: CRISPR-associated endonuclease Cas3'' [Ruthenibacterium lactatiformans]